MIPIAIVGFWLIMMGLLAQRELLVTRLGADGQTHADVPTETWMRILLPGDVPAGFLNINTLPTVRDQEAGTLVQLSTQVKLTLFGEEATLNVLGSSWMSRERGLVECDFRIRSGDVSSRIRAEVRDGVLEVTLDTAGEKIPMQFPVGKGLALFGGGGMGAFSLPPPGSGGEYVVETFDPFTLSTTPVRVRTLGEEELMVSGKAVPVTVVLVDASGMQTRAWIDADGQVVRAETPLGLILERSTPNQAVARIDRGASGDFLQFTAIQPTGVPPLRDARRMTFTVSGLDDPDQGLPEDAWQTRVGPGMYTVAVPGTPASSVESPDDLARYLEPDLLAQSAHPKIIAAALEAVGDVTDPWQKALALYKWVYAHIEKTPVVSLPSALEVLEARKGDCNEHTVLYVAMARAAGIPSRIALGIVWSEELQGFYYHAWPEVHVGGWIWTDPTLGQPLADATHVKLLNGGIETWPRLLPFIGRLRLDIQAVEP
jgi:transglutaminase-like putative cysteine protease